MGKSSGSKCVWLAFLALAIVECAAADILVKGRVSSSGSPLSGARIQLLHGTAGWWDRQSLPESEALAEVSSDMAGQFSLAAPFPGLWRVRVMAQDHVMQDIWLEPLLTPTTLPDLQLPAGRTIEVRVRDSDGRPARAWLAAEVERSRGGWEWQTPTAPVRTDALGRARLTLPLLPEDEIRLWVGGQGAWPRVVNAAPETLTEITLEASPTRTLQLSDPAGRPIAAAWISSAGRVVLPLAKTGADGRATVAVPEGRTVDLLLTTEDGWRARRRLLPPNEAGPGLTTLTLAPPRAFHGEVLDRPTGVPVAGAVVWARSEHGLVWARSNRQGAFTLAADDPPPPFLNVTARGYQEARARIDVARATMINLMPRRLGIGRVVDAEGRGVAGAEIRWSRSPIPGTGSPGRPSLKSALTDTDGRFQVSNPPGRPPDEQTLQVVANGYHPLSLPIREIAAADGVLDLGVIELSSVERLAGWVTDERGEPLAEADVLLLTTDQATASNRWMMSKASDATVSIEDGSFTFGGSVPAGTYALRIAREGYLPALVRGVEVPSPEPLSVILEEATTIAGWVLGDQGTAVEGALVTVQVRSVSAEDHATTVRSAFSSDNGRFEIDGLTLEPVWITVRATGFQEARREIERPSELQEDLEIVLERGASIGGLVRDPRGLVVAGALVTAQLAETESDGARVLTYTDENGRFQFLGLAAGAWSLLAEDSHGRRTAGSVLIDQDAAELDLTLEGGVEISGRIQDVDGHPAVGVTLALLDPFTDRSSTITQSDSAGQYLFPEVPAGPYALLVFQPGSAPSRHMLRVEDFPVVGLDFTVLAASIEQ